MDRMEELLAEKITHSRTPKEYTYFSDIYNLLVKKGLIEDKRGL